MDAPSNRGVFRDRLNKESHFYNMKEKKGAGIVFLLFLFSIFVLNSVNAGDFSRWESYIINCTEQGADSITSNCLSVTTFSGLQYGCDYIEMTYYLNESLVYIDEFFIIQALDSHSTNARRIEVTSGTQLLYNFSDQNLAPSCIGNTEDFANGYGFNDTFLTVPSNEITVKLYCPNTDSCGTDIGLLYDINMSGYVTNFSNQLPEYNITFDKTLVCIENENETVQFNFTIDAYDSEGDSIVYGDNIRQNSYSLFFDESTTDFEKLANIFGGKCNVLNPPWCSIKKDFDDLIYFSIRTDDCDISTSTIYAGDKQNLVGLNGVSLELNNNCNGENVVNYLLGDFSTDLILNTRIFLNSETFMNISIAQSDFTKKYSLMMNSSTTSTTFNFYNDGDIQNIGTYDYIGNMLIILDSRFVFNNNTIDLTILNLSNNNFVDIVINDSSPSNDLINWIQYEGDDSSSGKDNYIDTITYSTITTVLTFESTKPNNITFYGEGLHFFDLVISDSFNILTDTYKQERYLFNVYLCEDFIDSTTKEGEFGKIVKGADGIKSMNLILCSTTKTILAGFGLDVNVCNYFQWFALVFSLILGLATAAFLLNVLPSHSLPIGMIVFTLSMLINWYIIPMSTTVMIISAIIGALGLSLTMLSFFGGGSSA